MPEAKNNLYEGLILLNQQDVATDFNGCIDYLKEVFERIGAQIHAITRWGEHRLAYEIKGQKRGTYVLVHFNAPSLQITNMERDFRLSDKVVRFMFLRADHLGVYGYDRPVSPALDAFAERATVFENAV